MAIISTTQYKDFSKNFFSRDELQSFKFCNRTKLILDVSLIWGQALLGVLIVCSVSSIWLEVLGVLIVGSSQHGLSLVAHEGVHTLLCNQGGGMTFLQDGFLRRQYCCLLRHIERDISNIIFVRAPMRILKICIGKKSQEFYCS